MKAFKILIFGSSIFIFTGCMPFIGVDVPVGKHGDIVIGTGGVGVGIH